jgi:transcription elongation GreA/GreB family factor
MATKKKSTASMLSSAAATSSPSASAGPSLKAALVQQVITRLQGDLDAVLRAAKDAHEAATHEEAKPENSKDTRGLVESYLAAGQAARAVELQRDLQAMKALALALPEAMSAVGVGALVTLRDEDSDAVSWSLVLPAGAGTALSVDERRVQVITPQAPLARAVMGRKAGDLIEVVIAGKARTFAVDAVS